MDALHRACALNNMGVSMIASGETSKCATAFRRALSAMQQATREFDQEASTNVKSSTSRGFVYPAICGNIEPSLSHQHVVSSSYALALPLYLQFGYKAENMENDDEEAQVDTISISQSKAATYSAAIISNLAICFHRRGQQGKGNHLKQALRLYRICLQLLSDVSESDTPGLVSLLAVVALNNMSDCHYELGDYPESQDCVAEMTRLLFEPDTKSEIEASGVQSSLLNALLLNSLLIRDQSSSAAHAA
jgi:tetratricopeptide (TPR) repeat protein